MTTLYLCRHCHKDTGTPKPFAMVVACPNCKLVTAASVAKAIGDQEKAKRTLGMTHEEVAEKAEKAVLSMADEVKRLRESNGEMEQRLSDNSFYMGKLFTRIIEKFGMNPDSDTWFDIADKVDQVVDRLAVVEKEWADEAAEHRITQVNRDTWRSNYHDAFSKSAQTREALNAMVDAFDIGQPATPTSAIGKARIALKRK